MAMAIQLSETCLRSLLRHSGHAPFRRSFVARSQHRLFQFNTLPVSCPESSSSKRDRFEHKLRQCHSHQPPEPKAVSELWSAYLEWQPQTSNEYEKLMHSLHSRAQATRRSINWERSLKAYQDAMDRGIRITLPMAHMAITAYGRTGQLDKAKETFAQLEQLDLVDETAYNRLIDAEFNTNRLQDAYLTIQDGKCKGILKNDVLIRHVDRYVQLSIVKRNILRAVTAVEEWNVEDADVTRHLWQSYYDHMDIQLGNRHWSSSEAIDQFVEQFKRRVTGEVRVPCHALSLYTPDRLDHLMNLMRRAVPTYTPTQKTDTILYIVSRQRDIRPTALFSRQLPTPPNPCTSRTYTQSLQQASVNLLDKDSYEAFILAFLSANDMDAAQRMAVNMQKRFGMDTRTHLAIVQGWAQQGELAQAARWLDESKYATLVKRQLQDPGALDAYAVVMEGWISAGEWNKCLDQFKSLKVSVGDLAYKNRRIVKAATVAMLAQGDFRSTERLLARRQIQFTPTTVTRITQTLLSARNGEAYRVPGHVAIRGLDMMERILDVQMNLVAIRRIIAKLGERGDLTDAYALYRNYRHSATHGRRIHLVFEAMMDAATDNNNIHVAEQVFFDLCEWYQTHRGPDARPPLSSYNHLLDTYASRQPLPHAGKVTKVFQRIVNEGYEPDTATYNILIKAFVNLSNLQAAHSIFQTMIKAGQKPDKWTVNTLIQGWVDEHDLAGVKRFMQELGTLDLSLDTVSFNLLVKGLLRLDRRRMSAIRLCRRLHRPSMMKKLQREGNDEYSLSSENIWTIFESIFGFGRAEAITAAASAASPRPVTGYNTTPDEVTFKLFIKAFQSAKDEASAGTIKNLWKASL
ncbi:hypothetical protein BX666DRAFT_2024460 [Dichotomocladium elegans]|nr:hypothetical protein BX666DRAFT_2024460 [Dichotomocladium elegans]